MNVFIFVLFVDIMPLVIIFGALYLVYRKTKKFPHISLVQRGIFSIVISTIWTVIGYVGLDKKIFNINLAGAILLISGFGYGMGISRLMRAKKESEHRSV
ncbi:MAG: hypothetical protein ACHQUB_02085 [Candidatus Saccharimonadia bacterium]